MAQGTQHDEPAANLANVKIQLDIRHVNQHRSSWRLPVAYDDVWTSNAIHANYEQWYCKKKAENNADKLCMNYK